MKKPILNVELQPWDTSKRGAPPSTQDRILASAGVYAVDLMKL